MTTSLLPSLRKRSTQTASDGASAEAEAAPAQELPPAGYAIARLPDGRFAPLGMVPFRAGEPLAGVYLLRRSAEIIPQALDTRQDGSDVIACDSYLDALAWCKRRAEIPYLLYQAQVAALRSECYPERNVWYREETERLLRQAGYDWPGLPESCDGDGDGDEQKRDAESKGPCCIVEALDGCPRLLAWLELRRAGERPRCPLSHLHVEAANLDELWQRLYEAVSTILARQRKEADDELLPLAQPPSEAHPTPRR